MRSIHRILIAYGMAILSICLYLAGATYAIVTDNQVHTTILAKQQESTTEEMKKPVDYHLAIRNGQVVILKNDEIFETTGIEEETMSQELQLEVKKKMAFKTAEDVYLFLESCSS